MNKDMKSMLKDAVILFAITVVAGCILGAVYQVTKEPIARQEQLAKQEAYQEVFTDAESFVMPGGFNQEAAYQVIAAQYPEQDIEEVMHALDGSGQVMGYVLTVVTHEGYGGDIRFSLGIQMDGTVNGISLLNIAETPGLGMNAEHDLKPQFAGKAVEKFEYTKTGAAAESQVDVISGATRTTNAIVNGVNAGLYYFQTELGGGALHE